METRMHSWSSSPRRFLLLTIFCGWLSRQVSGQCIARVNSLIALEQGVVDTSVKRTYSLCPNTIFSIGVFDFNYMVQDGQAMLPLRPNMHIRCGTDGSRENNCFVEGGDVQVDGTDKFGLNPSEALENVILEGITFFSARMYSVWINKPGSVTFLDCEFREFNKALTPVLADYFNEDQANTELSLTFESCKFADNRFFGMPAQPSLVVGNGRQNRLIFDRCIFENNDMMHNNTKSDRNSFLIETSGPLSILDSCFENNQVGVSPAIVYGFHQFAFVDNFGNETTGRICPLAGRFLNSNQFDLFTPICAGFDSPDCRAFGTPEPTTPPTMSPTAPTSTPSKAPSSMPSSMPSMSAAPTTETPAPTTAFPSTSPSTSAPSAAPSDMPSSGPSTIAPTAGPSMEPSEAEITGRGGSIVLDTSGAYMMSPTCRLVVALVLGVVALWAL